MPMTQYRFDPVPEKYIETIGRAVAIARTYASSGDSLTLRQLYYRFVANGWLENKDVKYKWLGNVLNVARYAGLFDWRWIVDRTRNVLGGDGTDTDPADVVRDLYFYAAIWEGQPKRIEVWVEKDALRDIVGRACGPLRTPYFSCRGYTSASEVWAAAQRIEGYFNTDGVEDVLIVHLGDHDPSGIDMSRDIEDRLNEFLVGDGYNEVSFDRIALNMDQVEQYQPPPNPAKITDSRARDYISRFGYDSWELDALEPTVLRRLITNRLRDEIDFTLWEERMGFQVRNQAILDAFGEHYEEIASFLEDRGLVDLSTPDEDEDPD